MKLILKLYVSIMVSYKEAGDTFIKHGENIKYITITKTIYRRIRLSQALVIS